MVPASKKAAAAARVVRTPAGAAFFEAAHRRLGGGGQALLEVDILVVQRLVVIVVGRRVGGYACAGTDIDEVGREQGVEGDVIAHHADHGGGVVVERHEHALLFVGPRCHEVLQRHVVEGAVVHRGLRGSGRIAAGDVGAHVFQYRGVRRYAGESLVHAPGLLARPGNGCLTDRQQRCNCSQAA